MSSEMLKLKLANPERSYLHRGKVFLRQEWFEEGLDLITLREVLNEIVC